MGGNIWPSNDTALLKLLCGRQKGYSTIYENRNLSLWWLVVLFTRTWVGQVCWVWKHLHNLCSENISISSQKFWCRSGQAAIQNLYATNKWGKETFALRSSKVCICWRKMKLYLMSATIFTFSAPTFTVHSVSEVQHLWYVTDTDLSVFKGYVRGGRFHKEGAYKMFVFTIFSFCAVLYQFGYFESYLCRFFFLINTAF